MEWERHHTFRPLGVAVERGCTPPARVIGNMVHTFATHGQLSAAQGSPTSLTSD
jgi:hypothetical protein